MFSNTESKAVCMLVTLVVERFRVPARLVPKGMLRSFWSRSAGHRKEHDCALFVTALFRTLNCHDEEGKQTPFALHLLG